MALTMTEHLYEFLARVGTSTETAGRVVGMQVTYLDRMQDDEAVVIERVGRTAGVDWTGLVALMHEDDQDALKAALDAAVEARV